MKNKIYKLIPLYAILPVAIALVCQFASFYLTRLINADFKHYTITVSFFDDGPMIPSFMLFYFLAYIQWLTGYILTARESREICYRFYSADIIGKFLSGIIFIVFPTIMIRPEVTGSGFFEFLTKFIYAVDSPDNLFPSLHCLVSWLCVRQAFKLKKVGKWYRVVQIIVTVFVFASVLLVKQHLFIDVLGGVAVAEVGIFISDKTKAYRLLDFVNKKVWRGKDMTDEEKLLCCEENLKEEKVLDRSL